MGSSNTGNAVSSTFGGGSSGQSRATGATNLFTGGSVLSDLRNLFTPNSSGSSALNPSFSELDLDEFKEKLSEINPQFFEADFGADQVRGIAEFLERRGRGTEPRDPAFEQFRESQFSIFDRGAEDQRQNVAANLSRMGLGNSSTGLNQLQNVDRDLGLRKEALGAQIDMQELGRADNALMQSLNAFGQSAAAQDMQLNARSAGLENLLAIPALQVSQQAAFNAGRLPEERDPGVLGKLFGGLF